MPYKSEKIIIEGTPLDRRRKLSEEDKENIKRIRKEDNLSYLKLARMFGVSKRLVYFICNPEKEQINKQRRRELAKDGRYYNRIDHNNSVKMLRRYKQELYLNGICKIPDKQ